MTHNLMRQMGPISGRLGGMSEPQGEQTARKDALKRSRRTYSKVGVHRGFRKLKQCNTQLELSCKQAAAQI